MIAMVSGKPQRRRGAFSGRRCQIDRAAQALDGALYHIHSDAAPGQRRQLVRRREAGVEQKLIEIAVCDLGLWRKQTRFLGLARMRAAFRPAPSSEMAMATSPPA